MGVLFSLGITFYIDHPSHRKYCQQPGLSGQAISLKVNSRLFVPNWSKQSARCHRRSPPPLSAICWEPKIPMANPPSADNGICRAQTAIWKTSPLKPSWRPQLQEKTLDSFSFAFPIYRESRIDHHLPPSKSRRHRVNVAFQKAHVWGIRKIACTQCRHRRSYTAQILSTGYLWCRGRREWTPLGSRLQPGTQPVSGQGWMSSGYNIYRSVPQCIKLTKVQYIIFTKIYQSVENSVQCSTEYIQDCSIVYNVY